MIVPQFWAEARAQRPRAKGQSQITVRRFGWSDASQAEAEAMAQERVQAALREIVAGKKLARHEPRLAYNGARGVPIREEILARHGDVVVTRNAYGAQCLNTPDVLFADIDFAEAVSGRLVLACVVPLLGVAIGLGLRFGWGGFTLVAAFLALVVGFPMAWALHKTLSLVRGGPERLARAKVEKFIGGHSTWRVRLYRTPAGFRVLALHATFSPDDPQVKKFFDALGVDRLYATMCRNQHCFRARVSPKPWRIGVTEHMRPRPGVWPVKPEHLALRQVWIRKYEAAAAGFASCRLVDTLGMGAVNAKVDKVRALHDRLARAESGLEIA